MTAFRVVLVKECLDNLRDRRTLLASSSLALLGPALFLGLMAFMIDTTLGEAREAFRLAVVGSEHAPGLMRHLRRQNVTLAPVELPDPHGAVAAGDEDLVLVIDAGFPERYRAGEVASLALIHDSARMGGAQRNFQRARQMIRDYARKLGVLRLQLRGVDPALLTPLRVAPVDTATPAARALTILATLPYLLVLVIFMGGFYLAIDATAGEREHGSLEPLLCQPASRTALVLGKIAAASVFSAASVVLFLVSLSAFLPLVPLHRAGMSLKLGMAEGLGIFAIAVPLILLGAAMLTAVASFARSYKEAQTYLTVVILVPTLPLIVTQLLDFETTTALMAVPSLSQASLITRLIEGEALPWHHVLIASATTASTAAVFAGVAVALYRRERILA
ncbi:MAG: ABC transporter permease [Pseudomonadota bacterium]